MFGIFAFDLRPLLLRRERLQSPPEPLTLGFRRPGKSPFAWAVAVRRHRLLAARYLSSHSVAVFLEALVSQVSFLVPSWETGLAELLGAL